MDQEATTNEVRAILAAILEEDENSKIRDATELDVNATFAQLGINSIDLMEFVLRVEDRFNVSLLDEMEPEDLPETLAGWGKLVHEKANR